MKESRLTMSYQYCGLDGLQWAHHAFVVLFIVLPDVPVKNQNRVNTNNILLGRFEPISCNNL
jgi:hypothetical protein